MVMDDLERAVVISFDESGAISALLKSQAITYCQQIKETPTICKVCIDKLWFSSVAQVQFWCLQTLHEVIRDRYGSLSLEEKDLVRKSLFNMCCYNTIDDGNAVKVLDGPVFIKNKLAQVLVTLIYFEYPLIWSSVFVDLLPHLSKGSVVIDMFSRVLNALDDELISLDYPRTNEEIRVAGRVKDAMREQCVAQIVAAWYSIVYMYRNSDQEICSSVLDTLRRYVSWIDIGLIVNNAFILFLFELILFDGGSEQLRGAAAGCVLAIVSKKMDFRFKLTILKNLQINRVFGLLNEDNDLEFVSKVAELITGYATEVLECYKRLEIGNEKQAALELLKDVLPSVFYLMLNCKVDTTFDIVHFFSAYVSTMKSLSALGETQLLHVHQILEVIHLKILYDPTYRDNLDILDKIGTEEEDRMVEFRKDLFVLLRSVGRIAPQVTQMFIRTSLANAVASTSERNVEEVEAALSLFYALGESLSDEAVRNGGFQLGELVPMLLSARFACHSNRLVALVYLETISRHMKFVHENSQIIPMVLDVFLDDRGVYHPNIHVRRRASYLFMRLVKLLKAKLVPFIQMILQKLANAVAQFTRLDYASNEFSATDDGSHIFEALGLLIGMDEIPLEKQSDYLYSLLSPLCLQVKEGLKNGSVLSFEMSSAKITNLLQIIMAINALSKGFSHRLVNSRPAIGDMFKQTLEALIQILIVYPKIETLRTKITSYIHRMIDTLGESVFPYLPKALEQLLADTEPKEMVGFLILLNQLICKFNASFHEILVEVFPATVGRIFNVIPRDGFPSGPATNTEEIRELQELQKTLHIFLHAISTHDLSSVFLSPKSIVYFDQIMDMLLRSVCNHKDILVRKACVQIFTRLIKDWCAVPYVQEKVPLFQSYIMEFATSCCFYSVLDNSFDFHDANTCILLGEIVLAQKLMYEKYGDAFLGHFVSNGFRSAHCPQDLVDQYCQNLQAGDIKAFRLFYQSLIESLRGKENGYR